MSCILMLKSQSGVSPDVWSRDVSPADVDSNMELKRVLEDLSSERSEKEKLSEELYSVQEEKTKCDEKLQVKLFKIS